MTGSTIDLTTLAMTFDDEFNAFIWSPNGSTGWTTHYPFGGNAAYNLPSTGEAQFYGDATIGVNPFTDQNGVLGITATVAPPGSNYLNEPYNSGAINSFSSASQLYGYFEVRAEVPNLAGMWGAFWMTPINGSGASELDGFEIVGSYPGDVMETTHNTVNGVTTQNLQYYAGINPATGFHTYGVDWEPTTITWYIDGVAVNTAPTPSNMHTPMAMIINLAIGDAASWAGAPTSASEFPATMQIDYVRAYATANTLDVAGDEAIAPGTGTASISGQVLYSANGAAAVAVVGYYVTLVNTLGNVVANAVTNSLGNYSFTGLVAGTYQIQYLPPNAEAVGLGGPASTATNLTAPITLATGQPYAAATETLITAPATIEGQVIYATSSVGMGLAGITVQLLTTSGGVLATATTDGNGFYAFTYLYAGSYQVAFGVPAGEGLAAGGPASPTTFTTGVLTAAVGQVISLAPATIIPPGASLSGQALASAAGTSGAGLAGVGVDLLNPAGAVILTTTTNSSGVFLFTGLVAGTYAVQYAPPAGAVRELASAANALTGTTAAVTLTAGQALALPAEQLLTSPATITGGVTYEGGAYWHMIGMTVTLLSSSGATLASTLTNASGLYTFTGVAAGSYQLQYVLPSDGKFYSGYQNYTTGLSTPFTVSAGQTLNETGVGVAPVSNGNIQGTVYYQATGAKAAGLAGVTVSLYDASGDLLVSVVTSSSGAYLLKNLLPGSYEVGYTMPAGDSPASGPANLVSDITNPITLTTGQTVNLAGETLVAATATSMLTGSVTYAGGTLAAEAVSLLAAGTIVASTFTNAAGTFGFSGLTAGTYQVDYAASAKQSYGAGPGGATGFTPFETLATGQTLTLAPEALLPAAATLTGMVTYAGAGLAGEVVTLLTSAGAEVATTTTGTLGTFVFGNLTAGSYEVQYAVTATQLYGTGPANSPGGLTSPLALVAGETLTLATEPLLPVPATLDGTMTYGGTADAGATVMLLGTGATLATTTNSLGAFQFADLAPGAYQVAFSDTQAQIFAAGPADSATGLTQLQYLVAGETLALANEDLEAAPATLAGSTTYAGTPLAGEMVALINAAGATLATTTTGSIGSFQFSNLTAGTYEVEYGVTASQLYGSGPASPITGLTAMETLTPGQTLTLATEALLPATGAISGSVQTSASGSSPVAAPGVAVSVLTGGTSVASTLTDSNGNFQFSSLIAGTYTVQYAAPAGAVLELGSIANAITGQTPPLTLAAGQTLALAAQQMLTKPASLTASEVFAGTGTWPMVGATIALFNASGGLVGSAMTGSTGTVSFTGLAAGSYQLGYTLPAGTIIQSGPTILNTATGLTSLFTVAAGSATTETATKLAAAAPARISGHVYYTNAAGLSAAQAGDSVTLLTAAGTPLATITTNSWGGFSFYDLLQGSYQLLFTPPPGETLAGGPGGTSGLTAPITVAAGQSINLANQTLVPAPSATAALSGVVQTSAGGADTIIVGAGNSFNAGAGMNFITADGSAGNVFTLNGAGQGTTTIAGFNTSTDVLDLSRTLSGLTIAPDLSNLATYVTAAIAGGSTTLSVDQTGGSATPVAFAILTGVSTSVAQLIADKDISLV